MLKINVFNLHQTYQERRRDGPFDVLATLKEGAKSHSKMEKDERNSYNFPNLFY